MKAKYLNPFLLKLLSLENPPLSLAVPLDPVTSLSINVKSFAMKSPSETNLENPFFGLQATSTSLTLIGKQTKLPQTTSTPCPSTNFFWNWHTASSFRPHTVQGLFTLTNTGAHSSQFLTVFRDFHQEVWNTGVWSTTQICFSETPPVDLCGELLQWY